jgi:hypothetical protein
MAKLSEPTEANLPERHQNQEGSLVTRLVGEQARAILELQRMALAGKSFQFVDESVPGMPVVSVWVE